MFSYVQSTSTVISGQMVEREKEGSDRERETETEEEEINRERSEHDCSQKFKIVSPLFTNNNYFLLSARETGGVLY